MSMFGGGSEDAGQKPSGGFSPLEPSSPADAVSGWHPLTGEEQNCCSDSNLNF